MAAVAVLNITVVIAHSRLAHRMINKNANRMQHILFDYFFFSPSNGIEIHDDQMQFRIHHWNGEREKTRQSHFTLLVRFNQQKRNPSKIQLHGISEQRE